MRPEHPHIDSLVSCNAGLWMQQKPCHVLQHIHAARMASRGAGVALLTCPLFGARSVPVESPGACMSCPCKCVCYCTVVHCCWPGTPALLAACCGDRETARQQSEWEGAAANKTPTQISQDLAELYITRVE